MIHASRPSGVAACRLAFVGQPDWRRLPQLDALRRHHRTRSIVELDMGDEVPDLMFDGLDAALVQAIAPPACTLRWVRQLASNLHRARCIVVARRLDESFIARCVAAGAWGILSQQSSAADYASVVADVLAGRLTYPGDVLDRIVSSGGVLSLRKTESARAAQLPDAERRMLRLLADGLTTGQVAARLGIPPSRARRFRKRLMERLALANDAALVRFAIRAGMIEP